MRNPSLTLWRQPSRQPCCSRAGEKKAKSSAWGTGAGLMRMRHSPQRPMPEHSGGAGTAPLVYTARESGAPAGASASVLLPRWSVMVMTGMVCDLWPECDI
jgi:hypothetical protein